MTKDQRPPFNWSAIAVLLTALGMSAACVIAVIQMTWTIGQIRTDMLQESAHVLQDVITELGKIASGISATTAEITEIKESFRDFRQATRDDLANLRRGLETKVDRQHFTPADQH